MVISLIIAHRGKDGIHRENSLEGIINSLSKSYIDGVEFDIRFTKDEGFIINHDPIYKNHIIKESKINELKDLGLNTLKEVLDKIHSKKIIMIEVKEEGKDIKKISKKLYKIIKKYNLNIYVCSFNYRFIKYFKEKYRIKSGLIIGKLINKKHIQNNLDFNSISYKYKGSIPNKETFIWTVNDPKNIKDKKENVITDNPKLIYDYIK